MSDRERVGVQGVHACTRSMGGTESQVSATDPIWGQRTAELTSSLQSAPTSQPPGQCGTSVLAHMAESTAALDHCVAAPLGEITVIPLHCVPAPVGNVTSIMEPASEHNVPAQQGSVPIIPLLTIPTHQGKVAASIKQHSVPARRGDAPDALINCVPTLMYTKTPLLRRGANTLFITAWKVAAGSPLLCFQGVCP
jgi:hypothetical protein